MNVILCEKNYYESNWCREILSGLTGELKRRRLEYSIVFSYSPISADDLLYIIGSDYSWMSGSVYAANLDGLTPIVVFNQPEHMLSGRYHSISSDISGSIASLVRWLSKSKKSICLYGINPTSAADIGRAESYLDSIDEDARTFLNTGSLKKCFNDFITSGEQFDAVICTNNFAAVSLVKNLMDTDERLLDGIEIISCSRSAITECYSEYIKSLEVNFTSLGINAYAVSRMLNRGENISEVSLKVRCDMTFSDERVLPESPLVVDKTDAFYDDVELLQLLKLDKLLLKCDDVDREILRLLLLDKTYLEISQECHIVEQSVKYRVKQYTEICQLANRRELVALLNEYRVKV